MSLQLLNRKYSAQLSSAITRERIKWPLSQSKSISTGMMMVLKILTKQFVSFTNDNDFLVSWPKGRENIRPGKTSCCKSSCVCNAVVGQGSRPHFLVRREQSRVTLKSEPRQVLDHPTINLPLVAPYNLPLQKPLNLEPDSGPRGLLVRRVRGSDRPPENRQVLKTGWKDHFKENKDD